MSSAVAVERQVAPAATPARAEFRELLEQVMEEVDADDRTGALLRGVGIRVRFRFEDLDMTLNLAASEDERRHLRWAFSDDVDWSPRLELEMDSDVANRYLQGKESLAIAMARRRVRTRGDARVALLYVPALRLLCEPYRRVAAADYPHLAIA